MSARKFVLTLFFIVLSLAVLSLTGCGSQAGGLGGNPGAINCAGCGSTSSGGSTGGSGSTSSGALGVTFFDTPTCRSPRNGFTNVYLTVKSIQLSPTINATATSTDWVEAVPSLGSLPVQVPMFSFTGTLGNLTNNATVALPVGTYKSMRIFLANTVTGVLANQCGANPNCAILNGQTVPIDVTAEATSGMIAQTGEIKDGAITVGNSGNTALNIQFDTCSSMILGSSSAIRLAPKFYAWTGNIHAIGVTLSDATTQARIGSSDAIVAFEQPDAAGVDRIIAQAQTDGGGAATLYVPDGTFDIVADGTAPNGASSIIYSPLAVTGFDSTISTSASLFLPQAGTATPASINGTITAQTTGLAPDVRFTALQSGTFNGTTSSQFTIPLLGTSSASTTGTLGSGGGCPTGLACASYTLFVPGQPLYLRPFAGTTTTVSSSANSYTVDSVALVQAGAGATNCAPSELQTSVTGLGTPLTVTSGQTTTAATLSYSGCH